MKVVILGSGNAATVLGRKIKASGHTIVQVSGRNSTEVNKLAIELGASPNTDQHSIDHSADIYIAALSDQALQNLHQWLKLEKKMIVHTAAAVSKEVLAPISKNYGVLYPLQTLRKEQTYIPEIPFLVDANTPDDLTLLQDFASSLSDNVVVADDAYRLKVHVSAVLVSNFSNHLYTLASDFCKQEGVAFNMMQPLIEETAQRLRSLSPQDSQTGPAIRHDQITIEKHLQALQSHPQLAELYKIFTERLKNYKK